MNNWCLDASKGIVQSINAVDAHFGLLAQKDWLDYLQAVGPVLVGIAAIGLGIMQWRTAEKQRQQSLFSARYEVYEKILRICGILQRGSIVGMDESLKSEIERDFYVLHHKFQFLFSEESQKWFKKLYDFYCVFEERAAYGERLDDETWKAFKRHTEGDLEIVKNELKVV